MRTLLCLVQVIFGSSGHNIFLMGKIMLQKLFQIQYLRYQAVALGNHAKHDYAKGILQLGMLVQLIQHNVCVGILTKINADPHALTAGMIVQVCNSVNLLIADKFCDFLDQTCLIYQVWKLCNDNTGLAVWQGLDVGDCTNTDLAASGTVCFLDSPSSKNGGSSREIRTFYNVKKLLHGSFSLLFNGIVNNFYHSINNLTKIVRRNVSSHTNGNTCGSIYQKVGETGRKNLWLSLGFIKVRLEINGIFVDVSKHLHGNLAETCLCISHSSGAVTIHRAKVSVSVNQRIAERPVLCHIYKCSVDRAVTMRVIFTHGITNDTGTLTMGLVRTVVQFNHRVQHSTLYRLQTISYIWKCS